MQAIRVCQESEARNVAPTKIVTSIVENMMLSRNPKIKDVKYVTVIGLRSVRPKNITYVLRQLAEASPLLSLVDPFDLLP